MARSRASPAPVAPPPTTITSYVSSGNALGQGSDQQGRGGSPRVLVTGAPLAEVARAALASHHGDGGFGPPLGGGRRLPHRLRPVATGRDGGVQGLHRRCQGVHHGLVPGRGFAPLY